MNSFYEPISKNTLFSVDFDPSSHKNGAQSLQDTKVGTTWYSSYKTQGFRGLQYKATLDIEANGYLYNTQNLSFNLSNNYKLKFQKLILYRQKTPSRVSGTVKNLQTLNPVKGAEIRLLFKEGEISHKKFK